MAKIRKRTNDIISETPDSLTVDISTPRYPEAQMLISRKDWEFLQTQSIGRVRATNFGAYDFAYPCCKLRGKAHSVLYILFRSPRAVKCISKDWCDLRRENLENGASLKLPGEAGFRKLKGYTRQRRAPAERKKRENVVVSDEGDNVLLDISSVRFPEAQLFISKTDWSRLKKLAMGRIWANTCRPYSSQWMAYVNIKDPLATGGKRVVTYQKALFGTSPAVLYLTKDWTDARHSNLRSRVEGKRPVYVPLEGEEEPVPVEDIFYGDKDDFDAIVKFNARHTPWAEQPNPAISDADWM